MKKKFVGVLFFCCLLGNVRPVLALTFVDAIVFPNPTVATDLQSGTGVDFSYLHSLAGLNPINIILLSATLALKHSGNSNSGPTNEIWFALTGGSSWIGQLSESNSGVKEDTWGFSEETFGEILDTNPWGLPIALSEQTSFNGEKIQLYQSMLMVNYEMRNSERKPLSTPEPATWLMFGAGSFVLRFFQRKSKV